MSEGQIFVLLENFKRRDTCQWQERKEHKVDDENKARIRPRLKEEKKFLRRLAVLVQISRKWKKAEFDKKRYQQNS